MKKIHINYEQMHGHVFELIRKMNKDNWRPDYIVGITRGGLLPAVLISQYLDIPMFTLKVALRDGNINDCESNGWMSEDAFGHLNYDPMASNDGRKRILIVDDINDTGSTISWIKKDWQDGTMPYQERWYDIWHNNVKFATIVNNITSKEKIDYSSIEINKEEDPSWVVFPTENFWMK